MTSQLPPLLQSSGSPEARGRTQRCRVESCRPSSDTRAHRRGLPHIIPLAPNERDDAPARATFTSAIAELVDRSALDDRRCCRNRCRHGRPSAKKGEPPLPE